MSSTAGLKLAQLDEGESVVCYFDTGGSQHVCRCKLLSSSAGGTGGMLTVGADLQVAQQTGPATLAIAGLDPSTAVLCYGFKFTVGGCRLLSTSSSALTMGPQTAFPSLVGYLAVASLDNVTAIACYNDASNPNGKCNLLSVVGTSVSAGTGLVVNAGATAFVSLAALDAGRVVMCYEDVAASNVGRCNVVRLASGGALAKGTDFNIEGSAVRSTAVAAIGPNNAVVCYFRIIAATCKLLVSGGPSRDELSQGSADLFIDSTGTKVSVAPMRRLHLDDAPIGVAAQEATAVVCYRKDSSGFGICNSMSANLGVGTLSKGTAVTVSGTNTTDPSTARVGVATAVVCYVDLSASSSGKCKVLDHTITTTSTTTTQTATTTSSSTTTTSMTGTNTTTTTTTRTTTASPARPPTVGVSNIRFVDEDLRPGLYGGTLSWEAPPNDTDPVVKGFAVYLAPAMDWVTTRVQLGSDLPTDNITIEVPFGTSLATFTHLLVYTVNADGRQASPEAVAVHDIIRPTSTVHGMTFFDGDTDFGEIVGRLSWSAPAGGAAYATLYRVYLSTGASKDGAEVAFQLHVGTTFVDFGSAGAPFAVGNWTHFGVFAANADEEAANGVWLAIVDRAVPVEGAQALSFTDEDLVAGAVAGALSWSHPAGVADIDFYRAYLARDVALLGAHQQLGADVPFGASPTVAIGPAQSVGVFVYFVVIAHNDIGRQRNASTLPIADRGIVFTDTDLRRGHVRGTVTWWNGVGSAPPRLRVYLADGAEASAQRREVAPSTRSVAFTGAHHVSQLLGSVVQVGDTWTLSADLTRPTPEGPSTVFAAAGSRILRGTDYTGQPLSALVVPFSLDFGGSFDPMARSFELPDVDPGAFTFLHVSAETSLGASVGLRVGEVMDRATPEMPAQNVTFADQDLEKNRLGGTIRWRAPEPPKFSLQTVGSCTRQVTSLLTCSAAGVALGLTSAGAMEDPKSGSSDSPPYCFYQHAALKFDPGNNTGRCSTASPCVCDALDPDAPALTHYAVFLADAPNVQDANKTLLKEVPANVTEVVLELGTALRHWAVVLVGGADGYNEAIPAIARLFDTAVYGKLREEVLRQVA